MTSPAAADDSIVTALDTGKPKKRSRRQRAARTATEGTATERAVAEPAETSATKAREADENHEADESSETSDTSVDATDDADILVEAEPVEEPQSDKTVSSQPISNDIDSDTEVVADAVVEDENAAIAAAPIEETRKQRKARQVIEDANVEREAAEAKTAAIAAKQAAAAAEKQRDAELAATRRARLGRGAKKWSWRLGIVALIAGIAGGAYLAWPTVNERYVQPVESTAADVNNIQTDVSALQSLTTTENQRLADLISELDARTNELGVETASIQTAIDTVVTDQGELAARLGNIETQIGSATRRIDDIDTLTVELGSTLEVTNQDAANQLTVMRATELLSRSRLLLYQANYGLAKADLTAARIALSEVPGTSLLDAAIARLDLGIANLPERPVAAAGDIDIAWAALLAGTSEAVRPDASFVAPTAEQPAANDTPSTGETDSETDVEPAPEGDLVDPDE